MAKKSGVLGKIAGLVGVGEKEGPRVLLDAAADTAALINALLEGEGPAVAERLAAVGFPAPEGASEKDHEAKILAFLDSAATVETAGQNRPEVLEAITARGISILEPEDPATRPAQPPEGGAAPPPDGGAPAQPPQSQPAKDPEVRTELADGDGLVELVVLREDGLPGAAGQFIAGGKRGKFPADEAYAHLTAGNARLPTAED